MEVEQQSVEDLRSITAVIVQVKSEFAPYIRAYGETEDELWHRNEILSRGPSSYASGDIEYLLACYNCRFSTTLWDDMPQDPCGTGSSIEIRIESDQIFNRDSLSTPSTYYNVNGKGILRDLVKEEVVYHNKDYSYLYFNKVDGTLATGNTVKMKSSKHLNSKMLLFRQRVYYRHSNFPRVQAWNGALYSPQLRLYKPLFLELVGREDNGNECDLCITSKLCEVAPEFPGSPITNSDDRLTI